MTAARLRITWQDLERAAHVGIINGVWAALGSLYGRTIRYSDTRTTPDCYRGDGFGRWPEATYNRYVFLTLTSRAVILGVSAAPWVGRHDRTIPLYLAAAIVEDPPLAFDDDRQRQLRQARRA